MTLVTPQSMMTAVEAQQLVCDALHKQHRTACAILAVYKKMQGERAKIVRYAQRKNVVEGHKLEPTKDFRKEAKQEKKKNIAKKRQTEWDSKSARECIRESIEEC